MFSIWRAFSSDPPPRITKNMLPRGSTLPPAEALFVLIASTTSLSVRPARSSCAGWNVTANCFDCPPKLDTSATPAARSSRGMTTQSFSSRNAIRSRVPSERSS
jgi:hypothetical protein